MSETKPPDETRTDCCQTCRGTGEVHSHNPQCWDCEGTGIKGFTRSPQSTQPSETKSSDVVTEFQADPVNRARFAFEACVVDFEEKLATLTGSIDRLQALVASRTNERDAACALVRAQAQTIQELREKLIAQTIQELREKLIAKGEAKP